MNEIKHRSALKAIIIGFLFLIVIGSTAIFAAYLKMNEVAKTEDNNLQTGQLTSTPTIQITPAVTNVTWSYDGNNWAAFGSASKCNTPIEILSPADIGKATVILFPGQSRGGDYKPHGGIGFQGYKNEDISAYLAMDAVLFRGSRYIEQGEIQYMLDFINPCGIFMRYDHLFTLSDELMSLVENTLPEPTEDSRTTNFNENKLFKKGTVIATAIGHKFNNNVGLDFGLYDLRSQNEISKDPIWAEKTAYKKELAYYGLCWLDNLSPNDMAIAKALPGPGTEGTTSDFCK